MTVVATLVGSVFILVALRDIFQQLFHPSGGGSLSRSLMRAIWRAFHRAAARKQGLLGFAGPSILISIIFSWVLLLATGWALILWPHLPNDFLLATGLVPSNQGGFVSALYLSLVTLTTLGYGDITPTSGWLRVLLPLEGLVGFGLLTAAISWVLSIYPVLSRRRSLAREVHLTRESEQRTGAPIEQTSAEAARRTLEDLASQLVAIQGDVVQFPVTYYFYDDETRSSLPVAMPYLDRLATRTSGPECPTEVRLRAAMLRAAVDEFSSMVTSQYCRGSFTTSTGKILEVYARDHLRSPHKSYDPEQGS
jgi:hypothetical protein